MLKLGGIGPGKAHRATLNLLLKQWYETQLTSGNQTSDT